MSSVTDAMHSHHRKPAATSSQHEVMHEEDRPHGEGGPGAVTVIDVRELAPLHRHPLIFRTFEGLRAGESFILVNDHDPRPLYYQFAFERKGEFTWDYLEQGPVVWRVRIGKVQAS